MAQSYKLSLTSAVIINMNIMLGAGIFLNPVVLGRYAGPLSPFTYLFIGLFLLPLILATSLLFQRVEGGSFYDFGSQISPYAGYISSFSYFFGKLASGALMLHFGMSFLQKLFPVLAAVDLMTLDFIAVVAFTIFNLIGLRIATQIQYVFLIAKLIPILFIFGVGFIYFKPANLYVTTSHAKGLIAALPLVLYAFTGFEASTSLYHLLHKPERNASRAILYAFGLVVATTFIFQALFYLAVDTHELPYTPFFDGLSLFVSSTLGKSPIILWLLQVSVAISAIGGSYGILMSVHWNLFIVAKRGLLFCSNAFQKVNRFGIAWISVVTESIIYLFYLWLTEGSQIPLQQVGAFGCIIAYSISVLSLAYTLVYRENKQYRSLVITMLALIGCLVLLVVTVQGIFVRSVIPFVSFLALLLSLTTLFRLKMLYSQK